MTESKLPVTAMFEELIRLGHITPPTQMQDMRLPGEFLTVPSITTYGIPDIPLRNRNLEDAKLEARSERNFVNPSYGK